MLRKWKFRRLWKKWGYNESSFSLYLILFSLVIFYIISIVKANDAFFPYTYFQNNSFFFVDRQFLHNFYSIINIPTEKKYSNMIVSKKCLLRKLHICIALIQSQWIVLLKMLFIVIEFIDLMIFFILRSKKEFPILIPFFIQPPVLNVRDNE